ncbi:MAG: class I SAM-dependent methyltransferase [Thermoleophilaceae bacterium]
MDSGRWTGETLSTVPLSTVHPLLAARFFEDERYLRTVRAEARPADCTARALRAARRAGCSLGATILDAGCGAGRHTLPLARAGYRVVGLDRSASLLRAAPKERRSRYVLGSYDAVPFPDAMFDAVLLLGTALGYSGDSADREALAELRRVLVPGGRLVIDTLHRDEIGAGLPDHEERELPTGDTLCFEREFDRFDSILHESQRLNGGPLTDYEVRVYGCRELALMVENAGFEVMSAEASPATALTLVAAAR